MIRGKCWLEQTVFLRSFLFMSKFDADIIILQWTLTFLDFQDPWGSRCQRVFLLNFNLMSPLVILTLDLFHMEESLLKRHAKKHMLTRNLTHIPPVFDTIQYSLTFNLRIISICWNSQPLPRYLEYKMFLFHGICQLFVPNKVYLSTSET